MKKLEFNNCKVYVETTEKSKLIHKKLKELGYHIQGRYQKNDCHGNKFEDESCYIYDRPFIFIYYDTFGYEDSLGVSLGYFNKSTNKQVSADDIINFNVPKYDFKLLDKVLVKSCIGDKYFWRLDFFSNYIRDKYNILNAVTTSGKRIYLESSKPEILPYEGNEELLGKEH